MTPHEIIIKPMVTEKGMSGIEYANTYPFVVRKSANKVQVREAIESIFDVEVDTVRTAVCRGKSRSWRGVAGKGSDWKKAYVKLKEGHSIEFL